MIENSAVGSIMGAPAVGPDGDKIGTVGQVFVEPTTGMPNWATVHTGLFGRHETFVPLDQATFDRETLHLPYSKDLVKDAPRVDTEEPLTPESESELYRHYGITADVPDAADDHESSPDTSATESQDRHPDPDAATAGAEYSRESRLQQGEASAAPSSANDGAEEPVVVVHETVEEVVIVEAEPATDTADGPHRDDASDASPASDGDENADRSGPRHRA